LEINCHPKRTIDVALLLFLPVAGGRRAFPPAPQLQNKDSPPHLKSPESNSISEFQSISYFETESKSTKTTNIQYLTFCIIDPNVGRSVAWRSVDERFRRFDGMSHSIEVRLVDIAMNIL
jgi:hypothetical protein